MLMEKNPEILWNCESVGLTILNVSTSVLLGGVFFLAIQRSWVLLQKLLKQHIMIKNELEHEL